LKKKNGTPIFASVSANVKLNDDGIVQWKDGVIQDITEEKKAKEYLYKLNHTYQKFVPKQFLDFLEKSDITEIELGDQTQKEMSILFTDIRSFTTLSEAMSSEENFKFINSYLKRIAPQIIKNNGFIDKYIGDAVMALFPEKAHDAVDAAIQMLEELYIYNGHRKLKNYKPISIGIGINTGNLTLGIVGDKDRMAGTVISDGVNLASRMEGLTKMYGASILISEHTFQRLDDLSRYQFRIVDTVKVKGKKKPVTVIEILNGNSNRIIDIKLSTKRDFEFGIALYHEKDFIEAIKCFEKVFKKDPLDKATEIYLTRSKYYSAHGVPLDWDGIEALEKK
jgi:two-component system sensor histidine kinase ChiS